MDGYMNGVKFLSYGTDVRVRALKRVDTVVMNTLSAHRVKGMQDAIGAAKGLAHYDFSPTVPKSTDRERVRQTVSPASHRGGPHRSGPMGGNPAYIHTLHCRRGIMTTLQCLSRSNGGPHRWIRVVIDLGQAVVRTKER